MLHNTRNQDILSIAHSIYLDFLAHEIFIHQDRMLLCDLVDDSDIFFYVFIADCDTHSLSSKYVGRADKYRISQLVGSFFRLFCCEYSVSLRSRNLTFLQNLIEQLTVLRSIYILCGCSEDLDTHLHQCFCELDRGLSTELHNCSVRFLNIYDVFHILRCQRLEIQFICNVKVGADCFRVIIYDNCLIPFFFKCPGTVYGTEIEFNTLSDTD